MAYTDRKPNAYHRFVSERMPLLTEQGLSGAEAMKQISVEWAERKAATASSATPGGEMPNPTTKLKGGAAVQAMRLEVPFLVEAHPDLAAAWDVAEGLVDWLQDNAAGPSNREVFARRAAAAFARAKGETSQADAHEYRLGQALGEVLALVMSHRGLTANDWVAFTPPQLGTASGAISTTIETVTGLLGIATDINNDGSQAAAGEVVGDGLEAVLGLFNATQ